MTDQDLIAALLSELQKLQGDGDFRDSINNSQELRDEAARRLGHANARAFAIANRD